MNHARPSAPSCVLMRHVVPLAFAVAASASGAAHAVLNIGSHTNQTQSQLTTQQHANAIQNELQRISGRTVILTPGQDVNQRSIWTVTLGAQIQARAHGNTLVTALINSARTTTIVADAGLAGLGGGGVTFCANGPTRALLNPPACLATNAGAGAGTDAVVAINTAKMPSNMTDPDAPFYILFGHELVHAWHATVGQRLAATGANEARTIGNYLGLAPPVQNAALPPGITVNENLLRRENTLQNNAPLNCRHPTNTAQYPAPVPPNATC
ncbi:M91 family zinc metallopeptidase [Usitatibacter palustris]|uniref:Uncharacterized protein n=1 Tax=Usitatibacter palustris TaxID=2732487 RepID=A0A6M4H4R9_9PROT|nr:M91 family zinc metallopeptidase [Usitatibacter palustris]QJR13514.1 hypothetical protein DSM104440_00298 [Usitatibacter palustris]